jgi:uncharacterized membrane protein YdjX (TVP38/TMEM64 family)
MPPKRMRILLWGGVVALSIAGLILLYWVGPPLQSGYKTIYTYLSEPQLTAAFISSFGIGAPLAFMLIQILQVVFAPVPGEVTGFIGGYLFGAFPGFAYSTLALAVGSWINFCIGRFLGKHWVRKLIPPDKLVKFDYLLKHQGVLVVFILFLIPGFPKDYLCLFLGLSMMPIRLFIMLAAIGRVPGTLMLSFQGALVFEKNYYIFGIFILFNLIMVAVGYRYRESLYGWIEKINGSARPNIDGSGDT